MKTQRELRQLYEERRASRQRKPRLDSQAQIVYDAIRHGLARGDKYVQITAKDLGVATFAPATLYRPLKKAGLLITIKGRKRPKFKSNHPIDFINRRGNKNRVLEAIVPLK